MKKNKFWYQTCIGEKGKKVHLISESFWDWICNEKKVIENKRDLVRKVIKISNNEFSLSSVDNWVYKNGKPLIVKNFEIPKFNKKKGCCMHGLKYFCPSCNLYEKNSKNCPTPNIWITDRHGKLYVYDKFWNEFIYVLKNCMKFGIFPTQIAKITNLNKRGLRRYAHTNTTPLLYKDDEFNFTQESTYWTGLFLSDGHLRNNGSNLSYTYQCGSSNIFQGYWYPQFIQKFLPMYRHKKEISKTYLVKYKKDEWAFKTNVSSFSPIFAKFLEEKRAISKREDNKTSGYQKNISQELIDSIKDKGAFFQGLFDGDGHASLREINSIALCLAVEHLFKHNILIDNFDLVPTLCKDKEGRSLIYHEELRHLEEIRFAPTSLIKLSQDYTAKDIAKQLDFMIEAATNSIRPDKVHQLIRIIKRICSKDYGKYRSCLDIQKEIKKELNKLEGLDKIKDLERRYPVKENKYQPFTPKWTNKFSSKNVWLNEAWTFFLNKENLYTKNYPKKLDFSEGIPIDFKL